MSAESKITAARTALILDHPFFGSLLLSLKMKPDTTCKTAWVDGRSIGYNPEFVAGLTARRCIGLLAHEVMHPALKHPWRRENRDQHLFNIACDKVINTVLRDSHFDLPDGVYYCDDEEEGKSAEWIYARLLEKQQQEQEQPEPQPGEDEQDEDGEGEGEGEGEEGEGEQDDEQEGDGDGEGDGEGQGDGDGDGDGDGQGEGDDNPFGEVRDAPTGTDQDGDEAPTEQDWQERVASAALQAQAQGKLPAGMARIVEQAQKPKVDSRAVLLRFFQERSNGDYTWTRPNRRYIAQGIYLPGLHSEELGEVAVMVDTSGSMDAVALARARGIVESVIDECHPSRVSMYYADAAVQHIDYFEKGEPLEWPGKGTRIGGGGTDFRPALEAIERNETPICVVCITDLDGTFPQVAPSIPVLWFSTDENDWHGNPKLAPFGETVYVGD